MLVLFDLDNTLVDRVGAFRRWAEAFARERALPGGAVDELVRLDGDGFVPREAFFAEVKRRFGLPDTVGGLVVSYRRVYPGQIGPVDADTRAALSALRARGARLGIVTNGAPTQHEKIVASGLADAVDGWVISEVAGTSKPERAIFEAAAACCGGSLDGGWMVGDNPEADIGGAVAGGLRSVWIRRGRDWAHPGFRPDVVADTVPQAVAAILAAADGSPV